MVDPLSVEGLIILKSVDYKSIYIQRCVIALFRYEKRCITQLMLLLIHTVVCCRVEECEEVAHCVQVEEWNLLLQERVL